MMSICVTTQQVFCISARRKRHAGSIRFNSCVLLSRFSMSLQEPDMLSHTCAVFQRTDEQKVHGSADCTYGDPYVAWQTVCEICGSSYQCTRQHYNNGSLHKLCDCSVWHAEAGHGQTCKGARHGQYLCGTHHA